MEYLDISLGDIRGMQTQARAWSRGLKKVSNKREYQKIYEDYDYLTNPEEVTRFDQSQPCREAILIIEKFSVPEVAVVPTQSEYTLVRDFLLWHLSINNGARPGQFMGLTVHDFEKR